MGSFTKLSTTIWGLGMEFGTTGNSLNDLPPVVHCSFILTNGQSLHSDNEIVGGYPISRYSKIQKQ